MSESDFKKRQAVTELPDEQMAALIVASFQFSQGNANLQKSIWRYVSAKWPNLRLGENIDDVKQATLDIIRRIIVEPNIALADIKHIPVADHNVRQQVHRQLTRIMPEILNHDYMASGMEGTLHAMANGYINRDYDFIVDENKPGRDRMGGSPGDPNYDPMRSYLCDFVLLEQPSGSTEMDVVNKDLRTYLKKALAKDDADDLDKAKLIAVIDVHNEHHPDRPIDKAEWGLA